MKNVIFDFAALLLAVLSLALGFSALSSFAGAVFSYGWPVALLGAGQLVASFLVFVAARAIFNRSREATTPER